MQDREYEVVKRMKWLRDSCAGDADVRKVEAHPVSAEVHG